MNFVLNKSVRKNSTGIQIYKGDHIMSKVITAQQAAALVKDNDTLGIQGIVATSIPQYLIDALAQRYDDTQSPKNLTIFYEASLGDNADGGTNAIAKDGLIGKLKCAHVGTSPKIAAMVSANKFPAFLYPQGVAAQLVRAIAGHKVGVITNVGLGTFADPRIEGCKINQAAIDSGEEVVELMNIDGKEYLRYKPFPINICFIRGTYADQKGNLTLEKESVEYDQLEMAAAVHNSGGIVIAEVLGAVENGTLKPHDVVVPGHFIDYIVVAPADEHRQCLADPDFHPEWCGEARLPIAGKEIAPLNVRKVCGRRTAMEVKSGYHVNLGIGMPEEVAGVAAEEGFADTLTMSVECGIFGGVPEAGMKICSAYDPDAIITQLNTFDIYDGGGCDLAVMGGAEVDSHGNVNVSKFNGRIVGPAGFINITTNTRNIVFVGTLTAGGATFAIGDGKRVIKNEGKVKKYVKDVEQITFSGEYAAKTGKNILYVTERCVFKLVEGGLKLIEIAPGVDLQRDILDQMEFAPIIADDLKLMDARIFTDEPMNLTV